MQNKRDPKMTTPVWTLDEWVDEMWQLYQEHNRKRTISEIWISVSRFVSEIAEGLRKSNFYDSRIALAYTFCWLCSFVAKCKNDDNLYWVYKIEKPFSDIIAYKYPNVCPHCGRGLCGCGQRRIRLEKEKDKGVPETLRRERKFFRGYDDFTLSEWVSMFSKIYDNTVYSSRLDDICFHLMEETGEVARAIRYLTELEGIVKDPELAMDKKGELNRKKKELESELADVFSWMCSFSINWGI